MCIRDRSMLNKHRYRQSAVFSDQECIFLKYFIEQTIEKYPESLQPFGCLLYTSMKYIKR